MLDKLLSSAAVAEALSIIRSEFPLAIWETLYVTLLATAFACVLGLPLGILLVVGEKDDKVFIASEEAAIRTMEPEVDNIWAPAGGEPVIVKVREGAF